jgi:uracil-DNA glycosylase
MKNRDELLLQIKQEILDLKSSPLYKFRIENKALPVIGEGNYKARIMLIGEAPGKNFRRIKVGGD